MRAIVLLLPLMALGAAEPAATPQPPHPAIALPISPPFPDCRTSHVARADADDKATFRRLGELPPAKAYQAVLRAGPDGCNDPLLVSERINWPRQKSGR